MKSGDLTKEGFDRLLEWLGKDPEEAARNYEAIRRDLIMFFDRSVGAEAEDLADDTINLVIEKLPQIIGSFTVDPRLRISANVNTDSGHREHLPNEIGVGG